MYLLAHQTKTFIPRLTALLLSFKGKYFDVTNVTHVDDYSTNTIDTRIYLDIFTLFKGLLSATQANQLYTITSALTSPSTNSPMSI